MSQNKTYLNVPFAEKDSAKSLGAKWDASKKKWYAPTNSDTSLFSKWHSLDVKPIKSSQTKKPVITQAINPEFTAYDGDEPPWD